MFSFFTSPNPLFLCISFALNNTQVITEIKRKKEGYVISDSPPDYA
jgi:hypothetical protein